jgi:hypothetical protein
LLVAVEIELQDREILALCGLLRTMVQHQELLRLECKLRIGSTRVVGEFDFVGTVQKFYDGTDLPA